MITSCSHLFHATCLHSFEAFQSASHGNQGNINHHSSNTRTSSRSSSSNHGMGGDLDQWVAALAAADYSSAATAASSSLLSSSSSSSSRTGAQQQQQPPPRACPTCRTPSYQRRATAVGGLSHRRSCATKLQALARGVLQRKRYVYMCAREKEGAYSPPFYMCCCKACVRGRTTSFCSISSILQENAGNKYVHERLCIHARALVTMHLLSRAYMCVCMRVAKLLRYAVVVRQWIGGGGGDEARRRKYVSQELETLSTKLLAGAVSAILETTHLFDSILSSVYLLFAQI